MSSGAEGSRDQAQRPAVFLDRDGTVIFEVDYLADPDRVELLAGAATGLRRLAAAGHRFFCAVSFSSQF